MKYFFYSLILLSFCSNVSLAISFKNYHNLKDIQFYMEEVTAQYDHVHMKKLGNSTLGIPIHYLIITKADLATSPKIYINGTHHGNEKASTEAALGVIDYLSRKHKDIAISNMLHKFVFIVQPLVNPDGHSQNSRLASGGIDPNRDYPSPFGKGPYFQLKETQLVAELMERYQFYASAAIHSGMEAILWPWGSSAKKSAHENLFLNVGRLIADAMAIRSYQRSYLDYRTEGEFIDYAYMQYGTFAFTIEVSREASPDKKQLPFVVQKSVKGILAFASGLNKAHSH